MLSHQDKIPKIASQKISCRVIRFVKPFYRLCVNDAAIQLRNKLYNLVELLKLKVLVNFQSSVIIQLTKSMKQQTSRRHSRAENYFHHQKNFLICWCSLADLLNRLLTAVASLTKPKFFYGKISYDIIIYFVSENCCCKQACPSNQKLKLLYS